MTFNSGTIFCRTRGEVSEGGVVSRTCQVKEFDESVNETAFMMKKASGMKQRALVPKKLARLQTFLSQHRTVA